MGNIKSPLFLILLVFVVGQWPAAAKGIENDVVVSVYQGYCREGDFDANLTTARRVIREALGRRTDFLLFPEAFLSGYESREAVEQGARGLDEPELQQFIKETDGHDMVVMIGFARRQGTNLFNSMLVVQTGEQLGIYDKIMLTHGDRHDLGFQAGTAVPVFHAHGTRFAVIICHDTSFPQVALAARYQGARLLFTPHNNEIGGQNADDHRRWVRNCHIGLACQLKMAVARANIVKSSRAGAIGYGDSFILSPLGEPLAEAGLFKTELVTATITPDMFVGPYVWADLNEVPSWLQTQVADLLTQFRRPTTEADLRYWLENMITHHRFTSGEVAAATGLTLDEIRDATERFGLTGREPIARGDQAPLRVLPYPGGRHPRVGFLEGAVMPQRETKISVFTPWDPTSYVVVDVPEAIFSNLGLTYLAHTHIPTIWDQQDIKLPRLEWNRHDDGTLDFERTLPNGIAFGTRVFPTKSAVRMESWLRNGTSERLTGLRVQNCVMLKGASDFAEHTNDNKLLQAPYAACRSAAGQRWLITAWDPLDRVWANPPLPCLHSDPRFPDCPPGETVHVRGWLSFYEGEDIKAELERIDQTGWRQSNVGPFHEHFRNMLIINAGIFSRFDTL